MKQMVRPDVDALTVVPASSICDKELVFVRNAYGAVFAVTPGADEPTLFPVLANGRISRTPQPCEPGELLSVLDPVILGVQSIKWTNHRLEGVVKCSSLFEALTL